MVRKPSIARKLRQIPHNFIFFTTFGGKCGLNSMQQVYLHELNIMQHTCVHGITSMQYTFVCKISVQHGAYTIQKMVF
jgi:hypothetical protein